jgi:hypothetical protein
MAIGASNQFMPHLAAMLTNIQNLQQIFKTLWQKQCGSLVCQTQLFAYQHLCVLIQMRFRSRLPHGDQRLREWYRSVQNLSQTLYLPAAISKFPRARCAHPYDRPRVCDSLVRLALSSGDVTGFSWALSMAVLAACAGLPAWRSSRAWGRSFEVPASAPAVPATRANMATISATVALLNTALSPGGMCGAHPSVPLIARIRQAGRDGGHTIADWRNPDGPG